MKSWNAKVVAVEATQYGPKLVMMKKDGVGQWKADMGPGVDVTAYQLPTELHITFDDSGQYLKVVKVGPPQQKPAGGGSRGGWRPEPPEKTALVTATGIVKSALEGGHCTTAEDAVKWLQTIYPVALGYAKAAAPPAPTQAPQTAQPQPQQAPAQQQPAQQPQYSQGYNEMNPPPISDDDIGW